jgi:16S rRNA (uracil1498-N3)-methyltransferase
MNLVLVEPADLEAPGVAVLRGRRARHVREVHRAKVGDSLVAGLLGGSLGSGLVTALSDELVRLELSLDREPPPPSTVSLLLALPRPKVLRRVLQSAASLGVKRLVLVNAWRVEKSYFDSPHLAPGAIREELLLGLEQARDTILPEVTVEPLLMPFLDERLDTLWPAGTRRLLADPRSERAVGAIGAVEGAVLAVGPEGGWIQRELDTLAARGFEPFSLGPRILRVETALPYLLAKLGA